MDKIRIGINGFGRIGRTVARMVLADERVELAAINDTVDDIENLLYLFNYDSHYGRLHEPASTAEGQSSISVNGTTVPVFCASSIDEAPWRGESVDVVVDSSGGGCPVLC
ncbi:glyceraldehyde 3-phosphate dehydrogenase NAD-binding domain-containing protein [Nitratireductor sp. XY-223]|uniref:glyceraldehyde 3-phosphate dehydrogenase NAD-binding domain-containing protein n=1 Tax=Nitratireductor sp. XY-223 TaxID=2561926 RepID=UPI0010AAABEA|nr:glyceraldehyde 3-phosphate dehydrogenase NAD-binding domain-containing protein [Nitratireductor sp. XY-223]